jgi:hypothetical protein
VSSVRKTVKQTRKTWVAGILHDALYSFVRKELFVIVEEVPINHTFAHQLITPGFLRCWAMQKIGIARLEINRGRRSENGINGNAHLKGHL